ncbi:MAG: ferrous iron transporter B [Clostridiales bacterium]|jgi:ferrous iron transport protein B|nr:ferrous iron transporter B [Clostridiales bacterium]
MACHELTEDRQVLASENKILLMGSPNVGKSVFFSAFTNIHVVSSNYAGTTVSYMKGTLPLNGVNYNLIDVPGTYSLTATSEAEEVAVKFLTSNPKAILFVLNAADLEGSVKLALEVLEYNIPMVAALNLSDVAERQGRKINVKLLEKKLGIPVVPTVAVKGQGLKELEDKLAEVLAEADSQACAACGSCAGCSGCPAGAPVLSYWERAREIVAACVTDTNAAPSRLDRFGEALLRPWPGILLSIIIMLASLGVVVGAGKALRAVLLLPLVNQGIVPLFERLFAGIAMPEVLRNVLIGQFGIFRISFEWILALVMPYVLLFQLVFSFLEDSGILPRMAVLFDNVMSKLGVQGGSLINIMLGFGCAVPAIIGTRTATTRKERLIITTIVCFSIPCISQTGALISLLSDYSYWLLLAVFLTGASVFILMARLTSRMLKGKVDPLVIEIPNLLMPERKAYFKKFFVRVKQFLVDAEGPMMIAVVIAALLAETGILNGISSFLKPLVSGWLGLPPEASMSLILGIIRREMSVAPLLSMNLTGLQMYVGAVVSMIYVPCLSVFGILAKEFNLKVALSIVAGTVFLALLMGGVLNHLGQLVLLMF